MVTCTFAGHREIFGMRDTEIIEILETLLENETDMTCYVGAMGEFDALCAGAVRSLKQRHKDKNIALIMVLPYMQQKINEYREYYETVYDEILIPIELAEVHYKQAIPARNRWLVDHSDYLIACVWRDFGGAYNTLKYAKKQHKKIFLIERNKAGAQ